MTSTPIYTYTKSFYTPTTTTQKSQVSHSSFGVMDFFNQHFDHRYHNNNNNEACLPPGFRFHPTDEELITCYLLRKVLDCSFTGRAFADVDLNKCEPWELPQRAKMGEKEWYFFSLRDRKYPTGLRTNRATEAGYWKATGKDREIYSSKTSALVGMKKTLVFYRGRAPKGEKSNWVMHEYRLEGKFAYHFLSKSSKDEWVISRVFKKSGTGAVDNGNGGGNGKKWLTGGLSHNKEASCSSAVSGSLPPLLDSSLYASATSAYTAAGAGDQEAFSYDTNAGDSKEHVPCFSTSSTTTTTTNNSFIPHTLFDFPPPQPLTSAFPSLRTLQENLQMPFFYTTMTAPAMHGHGGGETSNNNSSNYVCFSGENWVPPQSVEKPGPTELDCIWSF